MGVQVGQQGAYHVGSESYPCSVVAVSRGGQVVRVQIDKVLRYNGYPECYGLEFERNESGRMVEFSRRRNGQYIVKGQKSGSLSLEGWFAYREEEV